MAIAGLSCPIPLSLILPDPSSIYALATSSECVSRRAGDLVLAGVAVSLVGRSPRFAEFPSSQQMDLCFDQIS